MMKARLVRGVLLLTSLASMAYTLGAPRKW
jgi:hypothetical protein